MAITATKEATTAMDITAGSTSTGMVVTVTTIATNAKGTNVIVTVTVTGNITTVTESYAPLCSGGGQDIVIRRPLRRQDDCYAMFELAYNACMSQGGTQMACGQAAGQVFDACVTNMCGAELDNR